MDVSSGNNLVAFQKEQKKLSITELPVWVGNASPCSITFSLTFVSYLYDTSLITLLPFRILLPAPDFDFFSNTELKMWSFLDSRNRVQTNALGTFRLWLTWARQEAPGWGDHQTWLSLRGSGGDETWTFHLAGFDRDFQNKKPCETEAISVIGTLTLLFKVHPTSCTKHGSRITHPHAH